MTVNVGFDFTPRDNWFFSGTNTDNRTTTSLITISDVGRIVSISAYIAGDTGSCTGGPCIWDSSGNLLSYTGQTVAQGSRSANGATYVTQTLSSDIPFVSGAQYILGAFRNNADSWVLPFKDNHVSPADWGFLLTVAGNSPGSALTGNTWLSQTGFHGGPNVYATYFPVVIYVRRSSAWTKLISNLRRSSAWTHPQVKIWRGGAWTQLGMVARNKELDWKKEIKCIVDWGRGQWEEGLLRWEYDNPKIFGYPVGA